jgi:hypothetical protein
MIYYAYFEQENGCDYTIACGKVLKKLKATNLSEAQEETVKIIKENYQPGYEMEISKATIIESITTLNLSIEALYDDMKTEKQKEKEEETKAKELADLERLKKKYEK